MSFNETDDFDNLMNEFTGGDESSPEDDTLAPVDETPEEEPEEEAEVEDEDSETEEVEESDPDAEEEESEEASKPKGKKSAQERISEVVAKQRAAERERDAERERNAELMRRLEALEDAQKPKPKAVADEFASAGDEFGLTEPTADDVDANGEAKYPLGEFDPKFMRDLNRYDRAVERAYEQKMQAKHAEEAKVNEEEQALFNQWAERLNEAEKTSPQIREKAQELVDTFSDAPAQHMQVLAKTIMQLDNGPSVLEYLADNLDEADRIVKMGTNVALLQLGRLDAMFIEAPVEELPPVKPTAAPRPPIAATRGRGSQNNASLYDKMLKDFR